MSVEAGRATSDVDGRFVLFWRVVLKGEACG